MNKKLRAKGSPEEDWDYVHADDAAEERMPNRKFRMNYTETTPRDIPDRNRRRKKRKPKKKKNVQQRNKNYKAQR